MTDPALLPPYPDRLSMLLTRGLINPQAPGAVPPAMQGGYQLPQTAPPQPRPVPPSTDPAINAPTPGLPTMPDLSKIQVPQAPVGAQDSLTRMEAASKGIRGVEDQFAANYAAGMYKPKWYDRLLGGAVGFAGGIGNPAAGAKLGTAVTYRKLGVADRARQAAEAPFFQQMAGEKEAFPLYKNLSETNQDRFKDQFDLAKEGREQQTGEARIGQYQARADQAEATTDKLKDQLANPKIIAPKTADEALGLAAVEKDPAKKAQYIKAAEDLHKQEIDRAQQSRPEREAKDEKGKFAGVEAKKQTAIRDAHRDFTKATRDLDPKNPADTEGFQRAHDDYDEAMQRGQDAYEAEITSLGGTPEHLELKGQPSSSPATLPVAPAAAAAPTMNSMVTRTRTTDEKPAAGAGASSHKVGEVVNLKGKGRVKITRIHPDGKNFDFAPAP